jgi:hypothetical protein
VSHHRVAALRKTGARYKKALPCLYLSAQTVCALDGEWPILLRLMGKTSAEGRYLSVTELRTLFVDLRLPQRITERLKML